MNTAQEIRNDVREMVIAGEVGAKDADIAILLLASMEVGATEVALKEFMPELDDKVVAKALSNLRRAFIVDNEGYLRVDWFDEEKPENIRTLSFTLDLGVAEGTLGRTIERKNGEYRYFLTVNGEETVKEIIRTLGVDPDDKEALTTLLG